MLEEIF